MRRFILFLFLILGPAGVGAQNKLKITGGVDSSSVSTRIIDGRTTARIIVESGVKLSYSTNMELHLDKNHIHSGIKRGMYCDTLYFFPSDEDNIRILYLEAPEYFREKVGPLRILPKSTYKYQVCDSLLSTVERMEMGRKLSVAVFTGASTMVSTPSIGFDIGAALNIRIYKSLILVPTVGYSRFFAGTDGSLSIRRQYLNTELFLKYYITGNFNVYAGYSRTFIDFIDSGASIKTEYTYKRLITGVRYTYYFTYGYSMVGLYCGIKL